MCQWTAGPGIIKQIYAFKKLCLNKTLIHKSGMSDLSEWVTL